MGWGVMRGVLHESIDYLLEGNKGKTGGVHAVDDYCSNLVNFMYYAGEFLRIVYHRWRRGRRAETKS